jgi:hypothetical protein
VCQKTAAPPRLLFHQGTRVVDDQRGRTAGVTESQWPRILCPTLLSNPRTKTDQNQFRPRRPQHRRRRLSRRCGRSQTSRRPELLQSRNNQGTRISNMDRHQQQRSPMAIAKDGRIRNSENQPTLNIRDPRTRVRGNRRF